MTSAQLFRILSDARTVLQWTWTHPSNRRRRARATVAAVRFQLKGRLLHRRSCVPIGEHSSIWVELHRASGAKAVYANPPEHPEMLVWAAVLQPGDLFVDVGANIGTYTVWAGDLGASLVALEPAPDTFALLAENIALNGYQCELVQAAAGARQGTASFTTGLDTVNRFSDQGTYEVPVVTLDDILGTRIAAGVKIDVEGYEFEVLRGARRCLAAGRIRLLQLEWNQPPTNANSFGRDETADLLHEFGYQLYRPSDTGALLPAGRHPLPGSDVFAKRP